MLIALAFACTDALTVPNDVTGEGGSGDDSSLDTSAEPHFTGGAEAEAIYDPTVMHELVVELDPEDWATLRDQSRSYWDLFGEGCMEGPFESPYTYFEATATYDGEPLGSIGVRKKGLIGSVIPDRPSLKLKVDEYVEDQRFFGLDKLVFNNGRQDQSRVRTCLAHHWFTDAGLVAPRCALAHVVVNGEDLGVYASTENIDENLVGRRLGQGPTSLYEGTLSDFREGWLQSFEYETQESTGADLAAVVEALSEPDETLLEALDTVIDLDAFFTFWAAEVIAGHWDGYTGNTNNFYAYSLPDDPRLHFIASGPDSAFDSNQPFGQNQPVWITTTSALANRLGSHDDGKARYEAELSRLLAEHWNVEARTSELDNYADLVSPYDTVGQREALSDTRDVLQNKAGFINGDIGDDLNVPDLRGDFCFVEMGVANVEFTTEWGTYPGGDLWADGAGDAYYTWDTAEYFPIANGVTAGRAEDGRYLWLTISSLSETVFLAPYVIFDPERLTDGAEIVIDGHDAEGVLLYLDTSTMSEWSQAGYLSGTLNFDSASDGSGDPITGTLVSEILTNGG